MWASILFLLLLSMAGGQAAPIAPTPAGSYLTRFLTAFNRGQLAHDPVWSHWYALYGPLRYQRIATSEPEDLRVWTKSTVTHTWVSVRVILSTEPPYRMRDIRIGTELRPTKLRAGPPLSSEQALAAIDGYLQRLAAADAFSGTVLIAKRGTISYQKAFGYASKRYRVANNVDTKFNIGSITKLMTAVAICQLADAGKLALRDPLNKFLPDYPSKATIRQLLTHQAGLGPSRFGRDAFTDRFARTVEEQVPMTIGKPLFKPGAGVRYSNEGYLLLGAIVEKASGENYYEYVRHHIYGPAGMASSGAFAGDVEVPDLATGYTNWRLKPDRTYSFEVGERRNTNFMTALRGNPAFGTYSTVGDLDRFLRAILQCKIVSCATRDAMLRREVARPKLPWAGLSEGYGYGFETKTIDHIRYAGKSGDQVGASAQLELDRDRGYTTIVLSNYDAIAQPVSDWITESLLRVRKP